MLQGIDLAVILGYLLFAFAIGLAMARKAGTSLESYFIAGRSLPWWWLGTSMVATTFASDTPLVITGFVAEYGIAGNWFWWSLAIAYVLLAVVFARLWQRSGVITDAEIIELRYDGRSAAFLRFYKAISTSLVFNTIVLGWVFAAMAKITRPFLHWESVLGAESFAALEQGWPTFLQFQSLDNTLTILALLAIVLVYSSAGGIRGVILTDLLQFALAMSAACAFAWIALERVGGAAALFDQIEELYPNNGTGPTAEELTAFWPTPGEGSLMSFGAVMAGLGVLWWANNGVDGSGYYAQRINTAKSSRDAEHGTLWFCFANYALRTWPWVVIGLVALVIFPLNDPTQITELGAELGDDREMAYPLLMKLLLPPGLLGLVLASLVAAFMSTVDTHINWGASYLANDVYLRFLRPQASEKELVRVSRLSVVFMGVIAIFVAAQIEHVGNMWKFNLAMLSGLGVPHLVRWLWWRANAWTEISGMSVGFLLAAIIYGLELDEGIPAEYIIGMIAACSAVIALSVTLLTQPTNTEQLERFWQKVQPVGLWQRTGNQKRHRELKYRLLAWLTGCAMVYGSLFCGGYLLKGQEWLALALGVVALASALATLRLLRVAEKLNQSVPVQGSSSL
ncbi:MAG: Na+:solute symporter [Polyangiaceae bacterium]|nr:Na+:solute symporter [Polyangiaceae bacterium]